MGSPFKGTLALSRKEISFSRQKITFETTKSDLVTGILTSSESAGIDSEGVDTSHFICMIWVI